MSIVIDRSCYNLVPMAGAAPAATTDRRRLRGEKTRASILSHAARVASAEGLEAVSLQRLADDLGISKSGLFAHFGSKEELQRAGEVLPEIDPEQLAWELDCLLSGANNGFVRGGGSPVIERARRAIRDRLERAATASAARLPSR